MVEIPTKECDRCQSEFDIDELYREAMITDHPHPEDRELGNIEEDKEYTLCGPCAMDFNRWVNPDDIEAIFERRSNRDISIADKL